MSHRLSRTSTTLLVALFLGGSIIGVISEIYRLESKGANYSLATWNDAFYYRSMVSDLWGKPRSIEEELGGLNLSPSVEAQRSRNYGPSSIHAMYLHESNGLAHQGPYAYRILLPSAVALFRALGMSENVGFLLVYCLGFGLLATFSYLTVCAASTDPPFAGGRHVFSGTGLCVSSALTLAVAATTSPSYPDGIYLGLSMLAVWAATVRKSAPFMVAATLAVFARETGVILGLFWLLRVREINQLKYERLRAVAPTVAPFIAFLVARVVVTVPDKIIHWAGLVEALISWRTFVLGLGSILLVCLFAPATTLILSPSARRRIDSRDVLIMVCAGSYALLTMLVATNTSRMALLVAPLVIGTGAWYLAKSPLWVLGLTAAPFSYLVCEQLSPMVGALGRVLIWPLAACIVLAVQLVAVHWHRQKLPESWR